MRFTKVFAELLTSSVWQEPNHVRILWLTLMVACDEDSIARVAPNALAHAARLTEEEVQDGLRILSSPDPHSRSQEDEGRRIRRVDGGYYLINYAKYRGMLSPEKRRVYMRDYMRKKRALKRLKTSKANVNIREGELTGENEVVKAWRDSLIIQAESACATPVPEEFPARVREALSRFADHRYALATQGMTKHDCVRWTRENFNSLIAMTRTALAANSTEFVVHKIDSASSSGYRGVKFTDFFKP